MSGAYRIALERFAFEYEEIGPLMTFDYTLSHRVFGVKVQVTDACEPSVTASPFFTCRRHKRDFDHLGYRAVYSHRV